MTTVQRAAVQAISDRIFLRSTLLASLDSVVRGKRKPQWSSVPDLISAIRDSTSLGKLVPHAFSQKIQRRLTSTVPPRPIVELSFDEAMKLMNQLCDDCMAADGVFDCIPEGPEALRYFLLAFSARKPEPLPYARSCVSGALLNHHDYFWDKLFKKDLELTVLPDSEVLDPANWTIETPLSASTPNLRYEMAKLIDTYIQRALPDFGGYMDFWKALSSNRCRLRRVLTHVVLGLDELQREGDDMDSILESYVEDVETIMEDGLFKWAYHQKLRVMEWIVQLGFELDIYLSDELAGMYWLLASISRQRSAVIQSIMSFVDRRIIQHRIEDIDEGRTLNNLARAAEFCAAQMWQIRGTESLAEALYTVCDDALLLISESLLTICSCIRTYNTFTLFQTPLRRSLTMTLRSVTSFG